MSVKEKIRIGVVGVGRGHGDFFTNFHFVEAIRKNQQPCLNVYRAIDMSICGILAYKSELNNSGPLDVPDFRNEKIRRKYENYDWSPSPSKKHSRQAFSSIKGEINLSPELKSYTRKIWTERGYKK